MRVSRQRVLDVKGLVGWASVRLAEDKSGLGVGCSWSMLESGLIWDTSWAPFLRVPLTCKTLSKAGEKGFKVQSSSPVRSTFLVFGPQEPPVGCTPFTRPSLLLAQKKQK